MGLLSYKIFIKFDEEVDYKELEFLGNKSFNTLDFLSEKLGDNNFIEKAKSMLAEGVNKATSKLENATGSALFAQLNDKLSELKEFYLFPVPPSELKFKSIGGWETIDTLNGVLKLKDKNKLQSLSFSSIIPEQKYNCYSPCFTGDYCIVDCWVCDEMGNVHPDYNCWGVHIYTDILGPSSEQTRLIKEKKQ